MVSAEIPDFDIDRAVNNGMLPRHYLVADATKRLSGYVGLYLQTEIVDEAVVRNLPSFIRFLEVAALTSGEMPVYANVAQDCGVGSVTTPHFRVGFAQQAREPNQLRVMPLGSIKSPTTVQGNL